MALMNSRGGGPPAKWLAQRLRSGGRLVVPGAFDALSARLIGLAGFESCYLGGYAMLASAHAIPDLGMAGLGEMLDMYRRVVPTAGVPVIVDADTGYGSLLSVRRTVAELSALRVAAIQVEDQVNPKKCGHLDDKHVVSVEEACGRIRVAVAEAGVDGPAIIARTDALAPEGLESAVDRANRYLEAGATAAFVDAPRSRHEVALIPGLIQGPTIYNAACTGRGPKVTSNELFGFGYAMVFYPIELIFTAYAGIAETLRQLKETGSVELTGLPSFDEVNSAVGLHESLRWVRTQADLDRPPATSGGTPCPVV